MRLSNGRKAAALVALTVLACMAADASTGPRARVLPNPVLYFKGQEPYEANGKSYMRYSYGVFNANEYPAAMFAAAPDLPPCGKNTKASRTWVDLYDQAGKRVYGFCALGKPGDLDKIWFALETDALPPSWIYIELNDRTTNTKYKSNLAETTQ
jgi:hypothetical protein